MRPHRWREPRADTRGAGGTTCRPAAYKRQYPSQGDPALPENAPLTSVRPPVRPALLLAASFAVITFLVHFLSSLWGSHLGYGFFRDELYYLVCGRHLAWGYVDQPPLIALQARLAEILFGLSPTGVRIISFAAGGVTVGLTGLLAWQLGGRCAAQALAMTAVLAAPVFLGTANILSMNSFEPCFWLGALFPILRIAEGTASPRAWLLLAFWPVWELRINTPPFSFSSPSLPAFSSARNDESCGRSTALRAWFCSFSSLCPTSSGNGYITSQLMSC